MNLLENVIGTYFVLHLLVLDRTYRGGSREQVRETNESRATPSPPSSSPFIGKVGGEVLILSPGGVCIYKRVSRNYNLALNIISRALGYVIGKHTNEGP